MRVYNVTLNNNQVNLLKFKTGEPSLGKAINSALSRDLSVSGASPSNRYKQYSVRLTSDSYDKLKSMGKNAALGLLCFLGDHRKVGLRKQAVRPGKHLMSTVAAIGNGDINRGLRMLTDYYNANHERSTMRDIVGQLDADGTYTTPVDDLPMKITSLRARLSSLPFKVYTWTRSGMFTASKTPEIDLTGLAPGVNVTVPNGDIKRARHAAPVKALAWKSGTDVIVSVDPHDALVAVGKGAVEPLTDVPADVKARLFKRIRKSLPGVTPVYLDGFVMLT